MDKENQALHFLKYNNTVPIVLGALFFATSATLAASPEVRESVYDAQTVVQSVDNSYIHTIDLDDYPFLMRITHVTEDNDYFYLDYEFDTIDIVDGVWRDVARRATLRISKTLLGNGDLEAYAESELAQVRAAEILLLTRTQEQAHTVGLSQKIVATVHSGLVGGFFAPTTETVPQYESTIAKNDPLRLKNPKPLATWDENEEPEPSQFEPDWCPDIPGIQTSSQDCQPPTGGGDPPPTDVCPDIEGTQTDPAACAPSGGGGEEPPVEEPPVEESPEEEPPAEEPPTEAPPQDPGDGGGDEGSGEGSEGGSPPPSPLTL